MASSVWAGCESFFVVKAALWEYLKSARGRFDTAKTPSELDVAGQELLRSRLAMMTFRRALRKGEWSQNQDHSHGDTQAHRRELVTEFNRHYRHYNGHRRHRHGRRHEHPYKVRSGRERHDSDNAASVGHIAAKLRVLAVEPKSAQTLKDLR